MRISVSQQEDQISGTMVHGGRSELLLLLVCRLTVGPVLAQVRHPLPVLWMMPVSSGQGGGDLTAGLGAAVTLALQDLKKQPPPLGNYDLQLQLLDSQVGLRPVDPH